MQRKRRWLVALVLAIVLAIVLAVVAQADGPVLWKQHCPRHHVLSYVADGEGGVHVVCTRAAEEVMSR